MDALKGAVVAVVSSLLVAIFFAYVFRIPIPFWDYIGPFGKVSTYAMPVVEVVKAVSIAWVFYGVLGGFVVLPLIGIFTGTVIGKKYSGSTNRNLMIMLWATGNTTIAVFILSILDFIIGPW